MKLTRDGIIWWIGMAVSTSGFAFTNFDYLSGLITRMLPMLSLETVGMLKAWIEFISFISVAIFGWLRMSPLALSNSSKMALNPDQTLKGVSSDPAGSLKADPERIKKAIQIDTAMFKKPEKTDVGE